MIIVNGQQMSEEDFARMQQAAEQEQVNLFNKYRQFFDCNNAIVTPTNMGYVVVCSIDRKTISNGSLVKGVCEGCKAYNNTDYTQIT